MKKITFLLSFVACAIFAQGQNLLVNPSFETWADGKPTGWTIPVTASHASSITITQETSLKTDGSNSFKIVTDANNNPAYQQIIPTTPGKTYTLNIDYYIVSGDGTDARIWCNFKNGATFLSDTELTSAGLLEKLKGPGGSGLTNYFPDVKGSWQKYSVEFVAPANTTDFAFEFRTYKTTTVIWDNMFFGEKTTSTNNPSSSSFKIHVDGKNLVVKNVAEGSKVEIFSALGAKVQTSELTGGSVILNNLSKGMYIVRVGKLTQKITL